MIIGQDHDQVIQNIKDAAASRDFSRKVEVNDPDLSTEEKAALMDRFLQRRYTLGYSLCNLTARVITWFGTWGMNIHTRIEGKENIAGYKGGAVITSNHFGPFDNSIVRKAIYRAFHQRIYIVSQVANLGMTGLVGFLMNYCDIIPIMGGSRYLNDFFAPTIKDMLMEGDKILIYPEEEMWFNYRKPRPPKRGAYYYAAANSVPVLSCFVEIKTRKQKETDEFYKTKYVLHILPLIYPDPDLQVRENSSRMMEIDYKQKKEAYEKAYGRPLTYDYEPGDVAGWIPEDKQEH
ncbi:MAG: 1-acyl-sn-glycerol-3-phosphate acyltransferase [Oscillospiraceae bacterium]|nr:1-acyl-sn-glycerol-3-phosphate acyltransferase [Oscillospiraceae bacterium]